jgi:hypothetical protein
VGQPRTARRTYPWSNSDSAVICTWGNYYFQKACRTEAADCSDGKKAAITEQARPANFDFESLTAGKRFTTPSGDAIINTNGTITTASLDTPWTWILLRSDPGFPSQSAEALINALEPL